MNQKIKTILNKYKESAESSLKYKREQTFIEKMNPDEVFEIFKCVLDEFYSEEEEIYPVIGNDSVMDHKEEDDNTSWKLIPSNDITFHIESCTTRRMMNLMEKCNDMPREIKFNENDHSLHIDYHTHISKENMISSKI